MDIVYLVYNWSSLIGIFKNPEDAVKCSEEVEQKANSCAVIEQWDVE